MSRLLCLALLLPLCVQAAEWQARPFAELAVYPEYRASASVVPLNEARLSAEVSGRIVAMPARVGERVAAGTELVRLDDASYRIEAERARAQVALVDSRVRLAEAQLAQARALAERGFISSEGLRIRETERAVLVSERAAAARSLEAAQLALERTAIRAPYAGVVRERLASIGDLAAPGTPLLVLAATSNAEVRARVPAAQIDSLRRAAQLQLVIGAAVHPLRLERVSGVVDAAGQVQEVVLAGPETLLPGLAGELRWRGTVAQLPPSHVQQRDGRLGAYVVREGKPVFVALPDAQVGRPVAVDWPADTPVVDAGRFALGLPTRAAAPEAGK